LFNVREATMDDCDLLYNWVNDIDVRKNAFITDIIEYDIHINWLKSKLANKNTFMYICMEDDIPIGQFRIDKDIDKNIDKEKKFGIIDFSVGNEFRNKGYGILILETIARIYKDGQFFSDGLVGLVKIENIASQKAFRKTGFSEFAVFNDFIEFRFI